ncbi:SemiSWEET transporter [Bacillus sp. AFS076308]|uniref:SemiSWEET transporter n=1 Tax=Bacillus sp. AFS076308 TaxID=2033512 RepID=UPI001C3F1FAC|nr:SemiSWEET transporter [Bacillus sp. AFS076308]
MEEFTKILGYLAAFLTTISFLPQTFKSIKEKNTEGISLGMYSLFTLGVFFWLVYGLSIKDIPMMAANSVTFVFALIILGLKTRYSTNVKIDDKKHF